MRHATLHTLAAATVLLLAPELLHAQDTVATAVTGDSLTDTLTAVTSDTDAPRHAVIHRARGSNPYLREVEQERRGSARRGGYYASFGVGAGSEAIAALETPSPFAPSRTRPTLNIGIGVNVAPALRVGLDAFGWFNIANDGALETVTTAMLTARAYPIPATGLYLRAGAGFGRYGLDLYNDACGCNNYSVHDFGLAYSIGGGFEVPVGGGLNLGPSIEMVRFNVEGPDGYRERVLNLGLTLTFDSHH